MKGTFNTAKFNQIFFNKPHFYYLDSAENIIRGANRNINFSAIRKTFTEIIENVIRGANRQVVFNLQFKVIFNKVINILTGANRLVNIEIIRKTFVNQVENILVGAGRKAYSYIHRRISKLKAIMREQILRFRVKRGL